jgi:hypothetical protein
MGVRQGCVLSPSLFILVFDYVLRAATQGLERWPERTLWPTLGGSLLALLGYADDVVLIARSTRALQTRMTTLEHTCSQAGLALSTKTKVMHLAANKTPAAPVAPAHPIRIQAFTIEPVETFTYLGDEVNTALALDQTVRARLAKANNVFAQLRRIWDTHKLPMRVKATMYITLVRPIALYGAETWTLTPRLERSVDTADMAWLRQYTHVSRRQGYQNHEVRQLAHCPVKLSEMCRQYRLRYYGHLCRLQPGRLPHTALTKEAPGLRRQGRPLSAWMDLLVADAATRGLSTTDLQALAEDVVTYRKQVVYAPRLDGQPTSLGERDRP